MEAWWLLVAGPLLGAMLGRWLALRAHRARAHVLDRVIGAPATSLQADTPLALVGTLRAGDGSDRHEGAPAVVYMFHGALMDSLRQPPASSTMTYGAVVACEQFTGTLDASLFVLRGAVEFEGDQETTREAHPQLAVPSNWESIGLRTLRLGDRVRFLAEIEAADLPGEPVPGAPGGYRRPGEREPRGPVPLRAPRGTKAITIAHDPLLDLRAPTITGAIVGGLLVAFLVATCGALPG